MSTWVFECKFFTDTSLYTLHCYCLTFLTQNPTLPLSHILHFPPINSFALIILYTLNLYFLPWSLHPAHLNYTLLAFLFVSWTIQSCCLAYASLSPPLIPHPLLSTSSNPWLPATAPTHPTSPGSIPPASLLWAMLPCDWLTCHSLITHLIPQPVKLSMGEGGRRIKTVRMT